MMMDDEGRKCWKLVPEESFINGELGGWSRYEGMCTVKKDS